MEFRNIVLITARFSNEGWGTGNFIFKALENLGCNIMRDYDFRRDHGQMHFPDEADALLMWKGSGVNVEDLSKLPYPKVMWYPDDLRYEHAFRDCNYHAGHFDKWYTVIAENAPVMGQLFGQSASYLPSGVDIEQFSKVKCEKDIDVLFIGAMHSQRGEYLGYLKQQMPGANIVVGSAYLDELRDMTCRSKIVFNYGSFDRGMQLRIPETLACGSFLVTNYNKFVAQDFVPGVHLEMYRDKIDMVNIVRHYLSHDEAREEIARNGHQTIGGHTWEARLKTIFKDLSFNRVQSSYQWGGVVDSPHTPHVYYDHTRGY